MTNQNTKASIVKAKWFKLLASISAIALLTACTPNVSTTTESSVNTTTQEATTEKKVSPVPPTSTTETTAAATEFKLPEGVLDPKTTNLRGEPLLTDKGFNRVIAVMLDNHPDARYQAGLKDADLVFEMPVEGSFTRYMALFQSSYPDVVGSVRSAREQFLDRLLEFDAVYMHFGGSEPADKRIASQGYETVDGMVIGSQYWRNNDTGKVAPHNAYTNLVKAQDYVKKMGWHEDAQFENYYFNKTAKKPGGEKAHEVIIDINSSNQTSYVFLPEKNVYERYKNRDKDLDENTQSPIEVSNIIVQNAKYYVYAATWQKVEQITEGTGYYISMGEMVPITWKKTSAESLTRYFTEDGKELILNPGQTWIQIVNIGVKPQIK